MNAPLKQSVIDISSQEQCYRHLKERILRLDLAPGARIGALEVAAQLGLSRTPVREALSRLEQEALVDHDPAGGYVVRRMSVREIDDLYRVREYLETEAVLEAMANLTDRDFGLLAAYLDDAAAATDDVSQFLISSRKFYEAIIAATGNEVLQRVLAPINDRVRIVGAMLIRAHALRMTEVYTENHTILSALRARDRDAAVEAVRAHVQNARDHVAAMLAQDRAIVFLNAPGIPA
ncbi:MAG: GntR family transcriptional regulator [Rhodospirillaceae bacterium]